MRFDSFFVAAALSAVSFTGLQAAETRSLGAHEHGSGSLDIAIEGTSVAMAFEAPGADIVGFEHEARSAEDRSAVDAAIADLARPLELFVFSEAARCTVTGARVELVVGGEHDEHGHDEHKHDDHDGHAKDEHAKDEHGHDEHGHAADGEEKEAGHTEFHAEYQLNCADPDALARIDFRYFERFPAAAELDVQLVSDKGAMGFEVERDAPQLDLKGQI